MTRQYDTIQPVAFDLPTSSDQSITVHILKFPDTWKRAVQKLEFHCADHRNRGTKPYHLPVRTLNRAVRALLPGVLAVLPGATRSDPSPWLVAWKPLPSNVLLRVASAWVRVLYQERVQNDGLLSHVLEELNNVQPVWECRTWKAADWKEAPPPDDPLYYILPAVLAEAIGKPGAELLLDGKKNAFRRAQSSPDQMGSELFSWPPRMFFRDVKKGGTAVKWYYSILLTLTLQTLPLKKRPVIHAEWGIRRWVSQPLRYLPWGTETSVFLTGQPLVDESLSSDTTFQVAPLIGSSHGIVWGSRLPELLNQWNLPGNALPDPKTLCADPVAALNLSGDSHAAIVYRPALGFHPVEPGISVAHRQQLTVGLASKLAPWATLCDSLKRCYPVGRKRISQLTRAPLPGSGKDGSAPPPLTVEIYTLERGRMEAEAAAPALVLEEAIRHAQRLFSPNGVDIQRRPLGALADPLFDRKEKKVRQKLHQSCLERLNQIQAQTPDAARLTPAFVELPGPDDEGFDSITDPKPILRLGLAQKRRLTQFFTPYWKRGESPAGSASEAGDFPANCPPRIRQTVYDMLRQMGYLRTLPSPSELHVPALNLVGLWLLHPLRLRMWEPMSPLPVMVKVNTQTWQVSFWRAGQETWRSYPEGLLELARMQVSSVPDRSSPPSGVSSGWLLQVLRQQFAGGEDVLLMVHAGNARRLWPWLENRKVTLDGLAGDNELPHAANMWGKLRVVRIRDSRGGETPEWYATGPEERAGLTAGLFVHPEVSRLFFSAYHPPPQFKYARRRELEASVWNPALIEILPLMLQPGDDPVNWAAYVHELRHALPHYTEAVVLPLPLHLAALAEEYAFSVSVQQLPEEEA